MNSFCLSVYGREFPGLVKASIVDRVWKFLLLPLYESNFRNWGWSHLSVYMWFSAGNMKIWKVRIVGIGSK